MTRPQARPSSSTRPIWRSAAWGACLGLVVAILAWAPARWMAWGVAQASESQVQLINARGTVWDGSAQLVLSGGIGSRNPQALPGRVHWQIESAWGGLRLHGLADCCMAQAARVQVQTGLSTWRVQLQDHSSQWPAALLSGLGAPWNTLQPDGQLQLRTQALQLHWAQGRMQMQGQAQLELQALSSRLSTLKPMGSYRIRLSGTPEGTATPELQLSTLQGPLLMNGQGQWVGGRLRFTGEAQAQEGHEDALANLLNIMGRRQGPRSLLSLG